MAYKPYNGSYPDPTKGSGDAFGRLRVSNTQTLFDSKQIHDNGPQFWDDQEVSGGSTTSVHSVDTASTVMGVAATTAGKRVRQTFMRFNYQPGKSQLILMTGTLLKSGGENGVTTAFGYFDDDNGIFLRFNAGTEEIVLRSSTSGSPVDTAVAKASWSEDVFDGTGPSGITLDLSKSQILFIDFEWLGVGSVRIGFVINGEFHTAHIFNHANILAGVYMSTPNLPLRYSIENDGTGSASTMEHICSTVISEGGAQPTGSIRYKSTAGTHTTATTENVIYAVLGIRLQAAKIGGIVELLNNSIDIQSTTDTVEWLLMLNPTVAGTFTYSDETNSVVQTAIGVTANTVTNGTILAGGYIASGNNNSGAGSGAPTTLSNAIRLGSAIDGTLDEMVLCVRPISGSTAVEVEGNISWRELS